MPSLFYKHIFKICPICGEKFYRYKGLSQKVWDSRVVCGRNCGNYYRRSPDTKPRNVLRRKDTEKGKNRRY